MMLTCLDGTLRSVNRLAEETSPYLRQHSENPVDWYPWGDEAFAAARRRNVPILLSVGYSACHWCHVMAHECFEDTNVAARMNELFVNVKVDREERPDVDQLYMDAVQALTGKGGWPMTVFLTPDAKPFYGGTYFPRDSFIQLLEAVDEAYRDKPAELEQNTDALMKAIEKTANLSPADGLPTVEQINHSVQTLARAFDQEWGGLRHCTEVSVDIPHRADPAGIHDQRIRSCQDCRDNHARCDGCRRDLRPRRGAALRATQPTANGSFHTSRRCCPIRHYSSRPTCMHWLCCASRSGVFVVQDTIEYVLNTLTHEEGGFFSAEDADSPNVDGTGVEGLFATWTPNEVRSTLANARPDIIDAVLEYWDITDDGNFETQDGPRSIPNRVHHRDDLIRSDEITYARSRMAEARLERPRPGLDDKVILEWNALFLAALSQAGATFNHQPWLDAAVRNAGFLIDNMRGRNGRWYRTWQADGNPPARHDALAADHAALIDAFTRLAESTGQARWINEAKATADTMLDWFFDPSNGGLYTTAEDGERLIVRQKDIADNSLPSANSQGAMALYRLAALTGEPRYANHADRILHMLAGQLDDKVGMFSNAMLATDLARRGTTEVVIVSGTDDDGNEHDMSEFVRIAHSIWRPDTVIAWGEPYDSPLWDGRTPGNAYVCRDHVCATPATTVNEFVQALTGVRREAASDPDE